MLEIYHEKWGGYNVYFKIVFFYFKMSFSRNFRALTMDIVKFSIKSKLYFYKLFKNF